MTPRTTFAPRNWKAESERYLDALATTIHERNEAYRELRECRAQLDALTHTAHMEYGRGETVFVTPDGRARKKVRHRPPLTATERQHEHSRDEGA